MSSTFNVRGDRPRPRTPREAVRGGPRRGRLAGFERIEEGRHEGVEHLGVAGRIRVNRLGEEAARPAAVAVVDGPEQVDAWHVPRVDQQVRRPRVRVLRLGEVAPRVGEPDHRHDAVLARPADQPLQAVGELLRDGVGRLARVGAAGRRLTGRTAHDALVAQRQRDDDVARIDRRQVSRAGVRLTFRFEARRDGDRVVAAARDVQHLPPARLQQFAEAAGVAAKVQLVAGAVRHGRSPEGDTGAAAHRPRAIARRRCRPRGAG